MATIIQLYLLENKSVQAKVNGYPYSYEGGYNIVAGDRNVTEFEIASIPPQYTNYTLSLEMTNALKKAVEPPEIIDGKFGLPIGMAVAGYGQIVIKATKGDSEAVFLPLKIKIANTDANWQSGIINIVPLEFGEIEMLPPDSEPYANNVGSDAKPIIDLGIPQAQPGRAATVTIGSVTTLPPDNQVTVTNTGTSENAVLNFGIPEGKGFKISRSYPSIDDMNTGYSSDDVPPYGFVIIETGDVNDIDNSKLFIKGDTGYVFVTDMSGAQGIQGESALVYNGIVKSSLPPSSNVGAAVIEHIRAEDFNRTPHDGDVFNVLYAYMKSIMSSSSDDIIAEYMMQLKIIKSSLNNELTAVLNNSLIMPVKGEPGKQGDPGETGVGIKEIYYVSTESNGDYKYRALMTDGNSQYFTAPKIEPSVWGIKGANETSYRTGNVNLTPENIGAVNKAGDTMTGDLNIEGVVRPIAIELVYSLPFIDFHWNNSDADYNVRLINEDDGVLTCIGKFKTTGETTIHAGNYDYYARGYCTNTPTIVYKANIKSGFYGNSWVSRDKCIVCGEESDKFVLQWAYGNGLYVRVGDNGTEVLNTRIMDSSGHLFDSGQQVYSPNKPNTQLIYNSNTSITVPSGGNAIIYNGVSRGIALQNGDLVQIVGYLSDTSSTANIVNILFPIDVNSIENMQFTNVAYKTTGGYTGRLSVYLESSNRNLSVYNVTDFTPDNTHVPAPMTIARVRIRRFAQ